MRELPFLKPIAKLEDAEFLDPLVQRFHTVVDALLKPRAVEDVLHGVPIGHPLHPAIVLVPAGTWISAAVLDLVPGAGRASRLLIGTGLLTAAPAILAGYADWARTHPQQQRVGIVHALANETAWTLYALSWLDRRRGHELRGRVLAYAGFGLIGFGGYLGGHLAYRQSVGANHVESLPHRFPEGWHTLGPIDDLPEGRPVRRDVEGEPLLVLRRGERVDVLTNTCSHLAGPLDEGRFDAAGPGGTACITCPWHASVFDLETGEVVHGPATTPLPRFRVRLAGDVVQVRLPNAG